MKLFDANDDANNDTDYRCPRCAGETLSHQELGGRRQLHCARCGGVAATVAILRQTTSKEAFRTFWSAAMAGGIEVALPCPCCNATMGHVMVPEGDGHIELDRCKACQIVWFDADERERALGAVEDPEARARAQAAARQAALPPEARAAMAQLDAQRVQAADRHADRARLIEQARRPVESRHHGWGFVVAESVLGWLTGH